jgi:hypothetical protein
MDHEDDDEGEEEEGETDPIETCSLGRMLRKVSSNRAKNADPSIGW